MKSNKVSERMLLHHREHTNWLSQLEFYEEEIMFFIQELEMVEQKNSNSFSKLEYAQEYKSIFEKKLEHITELRKAFADHERKLSADVCENEDEAYHRMMNVKFQQFVQSFEELKVNFKRFASRND
jgi:hypothetical protein